ncbi:MAG: hypothetical protein JXX29_03615 [Deltaproteobacteria bacterium]|nr:hypothetical protein [Deltaproteobacteria bacterium]MBN2670731.1 hypothetical protein [Deltaproteobacteria bacterium]
MKKCALFLLAAGYLLSCTNDDTSGSLADSDSTDNDHSTDSETAADSQPSDTDTSVFFIEHMLQPPDVPDCTATVDTPIATEITADLSITQTLAAFFQVVNTMVSVEDGSNSIQAETNSVLMDGYTITPIHFPPGYTADVEQVELATMFSPDSAEVIPIDVLTPQMIATLQTIAGCPPLSAALSTLSIELSSSIQTDTVFSGDTPSNELGNNVLSIQVQIQLHGHTQGGADVTTPPFTVPIHLYCGPEDGFNACTEDPCAAFCADALPPTCVPGVHSRTTCDAYLANEDLCTAYCQ